MRIPAQTIFLKLWFLLCCFSSRAQAVQTFEPLHAVYDAEDGLHSNFVLCLHNDSRGLLWIATSNGLSVYNGKRFSPIDLGGARETCVLLVDESPDGTIWLVTLDGGLYAVRNGAAVAHPQNDRIREFFAGQVPNRLAFENDRIYIGSPAAVVEAANEKAALVMSKSTRMQDGFLTRGGRLIGLCSKTKAGITFNRRRFSFSDTVRTQRPAAFCGNASKAFAIAKAFCLHLFINDTVIRFQFDAPVSNSIFFENDSVLWVGTEGAGAYKITGGKIVSRIFPRERIYSIEKDFEGGYWFGTDEKGLLYAPFMDARHVMHDGKKTRAKFIDAHEGQLAGMTETFQLFRGRRLSPPPAGCEQVVNARYDVLTQEHCNCFSYLTNENSHKISCIDWRSGKLRTVPMRHVAVCMAVAGTDTIYSSVALLRHRADGKERTLLNGISARRVRQISPAGKANLFWLVSADGIFKIRLLPEKDSALLIKNFQGLKGAVRLFELADMFIAASADGHFYRLDTSAGHFTRLDHPGRHDVQCVRKVERGRVLIGTADGLVELTADRSGAEHISCINLSHALGLPKRLIKDIEVIGDSVYCLSESEIFTLPLFFAQQPEAHGVIDISSVAVNGAELPPQQSPQIYNDASIEFRIASISFKDGGSYTYRFRLLPLRTSWQEGVSEALAFYNLPAGDYTLQVKDRYGKQVDFFFHVDRYFYEENWFIALSVLALASVLAFPFYFVSRMKAARARLENEKNSLRLRALTTQLKPHFVFNALSSIQSFILRKNTRESSDYLAKFAMHIRHALEQSGQDELPLSKALESLRNYLDLERMRLDDAFSYRITIDPRIRAEELKIPVMLIQPYVENAVIHGMVGLGRAGLIEIDVQLAARGTVLCIIRDNGKGFAADAQHGNGIGTQINRERMQLLNALHRNRYEVSLQANAPGPGVTVTIQISFEHEKDQRLFS